MRPGKTLAGRVTAVHVGDSDGADLSKRSTATLSLELDGIVGDRHRGFSREAWAGDDKEPEGTVRRNERQWSGMSIEEIAPDLPEYGSRSGARGRRSRRQHLLRRLARLFPDTEG